jgi:hypothetical protein
MKKLNDIFDLWYGVNLELVNCEQVPNGIPFISRQSTGNGIAGYVMPIDKKPNPAHTLSIAGSGSVLSAFFHDYEYYSGRDVYIAKPKRHLTKEQLIYYAYVIEQNKYRYSFGRQANRTMRDILVPDIDELPNYVNKISVSDYKFKEKPITQQPELNTVNWKWFDLKKIFDKIERGERLVKTDREKGITPLVTAGFKNEGIVEYISNENMKRYQNAITIDMFGYCFYRGYMFCCDDNILILSNNKLNKYSGLFIATILEIDNYKFQYGRQYRQKNFKRHKIKFPPKPDGTPDWQFMEDYIKSLPYSKEL